jgi:hypothetical protein
LDVFIIKIPKWLKKEFHTEENFAKARLSEFYAKKSSSVPIIYGIVTEIYTPDFRKPVVNDIDKSQVSSMTEFLEDQGFTKSEIWKRIGNENNYDDVLVRYSLAKKLSLLPIGKLRDKVESEIQNPQ